MRFNVNRIEVAGSTRNGVELRLKGSKSWKEGKYRNERNASETITVSESTARQIRDDLNDALSDDVSESDATADDGSRYKTVEIDKSGETGDE